MLSRRYTLKTLVAIAVSAGFPNVFAQSAVAGADGVSSQFHPFDFKKRTVTLNNGIEMPIIGIGVWTLTPEQAEKSVS